MSSGFLGAYWTDRPASKLAGDSKGLNVAPERIKYIAELRDKAYAEYCTAQESIRSISNNKRLKHKKIDIEVIAARAKNYFNFRSYDYFLFRIGAIQYTKYTIDSFKEGVEYELEELRTTTESLLLNLNQYNGFNDIYWFYGGGNEAWRDAGEPDFPEKEAYIREDLGLFYI
jgi:hypothetical protein